MSAAEDYVLLGLRLGRHVDGLVDSYCGPAELQEQVEAEEPLTAGRAGRRGRGPARAARGRLAARPGARPAHLRGRARGRGAVVLGRGRALLRRAARRGRTERLRGLHAAARRVAPGERRSRRSLRGVAAGEPRPPENVVPLAGTCSASCARARRRSSTCRTARRSRSRRCTTSPGGRSTTTRAISAAGSSSILDVPTTCDDIVELVAHEVYPGHHTEHSVKEQLLLRDQGLLEESIQLVPIPASLVSEGIAETGPDLVVARRRRGAHRCDLRPHGLEYDRAGPRAVRDARRPIRRIGVDAALMIHEDGASTEEAKAYVRRWALSTPSRPHTAFASSSIRPGART